MQNYYYFNGETRESTMFAFIIQHSLVCNNQYFSYSILEAFGKTR